MKRTLATLAAALFLSLLAAGCGGKKDKFEEAIDKMKSYRDQMCKCTDADCAKKVDDEEDKWEHDLKGGERPSKSIIERFEKVKQEYRDCRSKAAGG